MSGRKNRKTDYNPDDDPWDDRALIQAYDEAVKLHTSLVNAPASVLEALQQVENAPNAKKRQHHETKSSKSRKIQLEESEESEESDEEEQETTQEAQYAFPTQFGPYGYNPYGQHYGPYSGASYNSWYPGFSSETPTKASKLKKQKTPSRRPQSGSMDVSEGVPTENTTGEVEYDGDDGLEMEMPKAKRAKLSKDASHGFNAAHSMYSPAGLQPPYMGDVPMGYQSGYGPQTPVAPPMPHWLSHPPGQWPHPSSTTNHAPDNPTLWAYYYYGYAMGQYDALNVFSKKKRTGQ